MEGKPIEILMIEYNPDATCLTEESLRVNKLLNNLSIIRGSGRVTTFLRNCGEFIALFQPDVILLDLNLPAKNRRKLLQVMNNNDAMRLIPLVVMVDSEHEEDVLRNYALQVSHYMTKPVQFGCLMSALINMDGFGVQIVKFSLDSVSA